VPGFIFKQKKTSSGKIPEEVYNFLALSFPMPGAGFSTFFPSFMGTVAKASQGLIPPPFLIKYYLQNNTIIF
jgi:hypothetical protein